MAYLFDVGRVLYQCSCESRFPLCRLYFCRYCITLRCANCTQHEVSESLLCLEVSERMEDTFLSFAVRLCL